MACAHQQCKCSNAPVTGSLVLKNPVTLLVAQSEEMLNVVQKEPCILCEWMWGEQRAANQLIPAARLPFGVSVVAALPLV